MTFYITDTNTEKEITVRVWDEANIQYGQDIFGELETSVPQMYPIYDADTYCMTSAQYVELVEFWRAEVAAINAHTVGEAGDYSDTEDWADPREIVLFAD